MADADEARGERPKHIELPPVFQPVGTYVGALEHDRILRTSGHIPVAADGTIVFGRLGEDLSVDEGVAAARLAALSLLATVAEALGSLDRVDRFLHVYGVVNSTAGFTQHTPVIDGASDVFVEVFGERGRHTRLAVGVSSLPANIALEVEATIAVVLP